MQCTGAMQNTICFTGGIHHEKEEIAMEEQNSWEQPKLIVLGRGRPEEHVLDACKNDNRAGPSSSVCRGQGAQGNGSCTGRPPS